MPIKRAQSPVEMEADLAQDTFAAGTCPPADGDRIRTNTRSTARARVWLVVGVVVVVPDRELLLWCCVWLARVDMEQETSARIAISGILNPLNKLPRIPLNLIVLLDHSDSMSGDKLAKAKQAALLILRTIQAGDRCTVISFCKCTGVPLLRLVGGSTSSTSLSLCASLCVSVCACAYSRCSPAVP